MASILEARNVRYSYSDGPEALRGLSTTIEEGKKIALVGPNGAGKSTLMLMFNGILRPTSGEVYLRGQPMKYDSPSLRNVRRKVGLVFQNPDDQLFAPTVYQDVAFGPVNLGYPKDKTERYVNYALSYVGLSGFESRPPHHLSGGEKKRVAIAGVLAMEPEVMILDEPTSNLDPAGSEEIMDMLDELNSSGKTMIISTHDVELAYRWADEVLLMEDGKLLHCGPPAAVFADLGLVSKARMKLPAVMEIYQELKGRGVLDGDRPPRNILELTNLLETRAKVGNPKINPGKIYLYNVDHAGPGEIRSFLDSGVAKYVGAMGTIAKIMAEKEKIRLDFTFGVIDKSILKATTGQSSLIMTSGGMVEHALRRIEAYCGEWGAKIQASVLNPSIPDTSVLNDPGN
jgi:cobalt/nickel transport system ATP-binding protein